MTARAAAVTADRRATVGGVPVPVPSSALPPGPPDPKVIHPAAPVTVLLTSGREIHATGILGGATEPDETLIVEDAAGYVYAIAPDCVAGVIVEAAKAGEILP
jgi:hypothetical protein